MPGFYWNQDAFKGLSALAESLRSDSRLERLARYCELRERGLRRDAFEELNIFLSQVTEWDESVQRSVVSRLVELHLRVPEAHQFLSEPLRRRLVDPVLAKWRAAAPEDLAPRRQLGLLLMDPELLESSLGVAPNDDQVRAALVWLLIGDVEAATHHLSEGKFLGDEKEAFAKLRRASDLAREASDPVALAGPMRAIEDLQRLLADWREYQMAPEGCFPDWCRVRGRKHDWWTIVYYDDQTA
jgi:uncharacterized membrane protein YccC